MRTKLITTLVAAGCILGFQAAAMAQDLSEHPPIGTPTQAQQKPNTAMQYKDQSTAPANSADQTGTPAPGPHESGH